MTAQMSIAEAVASPDKWWLAAVRHHRQHPRVLAEVAAEYRAIRDAAVADGRPVPVVSMRDVFGKMRLDHHRHPRDRDGFAMNNNYAAAYGRLLMEHHPDLEEMVATRRRATDPDENSCMTT